MTDGKQLFLQAVVKVVLADPSIIKCSEASVGSQSSTILLNSEKQRPLHLLASQANWTLDSKDF
jgi:hypothetical protein